MLAMAVEWTAVLVAVVTLLGSALSWWFKSKERKDAHNEQVHQEAGNAAASDDDSDISRLLRP
jgi:hypothetical protein